MDRPIIFSGPMVRALLEGRKTMTRRLIKWNLRDSGINLNFSGLHAIPLRTNGTPPGVFLLESRGQSGCWEERGTVKTYAVGDRLYVRESYANCKGMGFDFPFYYMADIHKGSDSDELRKQYGVKWKPSIHMPRWASRLTLTVTAVKVERLQDITDDDAFAEGIDLSRPKPGQEVDIDGQWWKGAPKGRFKELWQSLNAKRAPWDSNPWVVAVSFSVAKINIERMPA